MSDPMTTGGPRGSAKGPQTKDDVRRLLQGKHDVFVSFSSKNTTAIDTVYDVLTRALEPMGKRVWCSRKGLISADDWLKIIVKKLGEARCFVVLLSEEALESEWVKREIHAAIKRHDDHEFPKIFCFRLDNVNTHGTGFELLLDSVQKVNDQVVDWRDDLSTLVEHICYELGGKPPKTPVLRRYLKPIRRVWRAANPAIKIGFPLVLFLASLMVGAAAYLMVPANVPGRPDLQAASDSRDPKEPNGAGTNDSDNLTDIWPLKFEVSNVDPRAPLQLLRDGQVVNVIRMSGAGPVVEIEDPRPITAGKHDYSTRQLNRLGWPGADSDPLTVTVYKRGDVPPFDKPEPLPPRTDGVIEISRSSVRGYGANLVSEGGGLYSISSHRMPTVADSNAIRHEINVKLAYKKGEPRFDPNSVDAVIKAVERLVGLFQEKGIRKESLRVVLSSGVRLVAKDAASPRKCMDDLILSLHEKIGGSVEVEEIGPHNEAGFLIKEVIRQNNLAHREGRAMLQIQEGDVVAIDIGSGNIKAAYYNPGGGLVGRFDLENVTGVMQYIPGTRSFIEQVLGRDAKLSVGSLLERKSYRAALEKQADPLIGDPLRAAYQDTAMLGQSRSVILAGGAVWAMCRIARPEEDLSARFVVLDRTRDITNFRARLLEKGTDVFDLVPRLETSLAEQYKKELNKVRETFTLPQLISAAEILKVVDSELLDVLKQREVYFITDGMFDWLAAYLAEKVNEERRHSKTRPSVRTAG